MDYLELTEANIVDSQRKQYKELQAMKRRELEKTIYLNASWNDKIKIRIRRFFERRRSYKKPNNQSNQ